MQRRSVGTVVTTSYLYDVNDERIALGANGATTTYPFKFYNVQGNTIYKHIFANGEPVADVKGSTTTAAVYYIHNDHLGGSGVISDASANVAEVTEYYPFGGTRFDQRTGSFAEQRRFTGHEFDAGTGLNYMDARYEGPTLGRFLSEDPAFLNIGVDNRNQLMLQDPQLQNSYSYGRNNPLTYKDTDGKMPTIVAGALIGGGIGFSSQLAADAISGHWSSWQTYAGATAGGAVQGAFIGSGAGIATLLLSGTLSGAAQGGVREGLNYASGNSVNLGSITSDLETNILSNFAGGALTRMIGIPSIVGLNAGRNSFGAITQSILTKLESGTISNVSLSTQMKMGVSYAVNNAYSTGFQVAIQARQQAVQSYNTAVGASTGGGGSMPSNNSLWVTPSGAVVNWGGSLVSGPVAQSAPMTR